MKKKTRINIAIALFILSAICLVIFGVTGGMLSQQTATTESNIVMGVSCLLMFLFGFLANALK